MKNDPQNTLRKRATGGGKARFKMLFSVWLRADGSRADSAISSSLSRVSRIVARATSQVVSDQWSVVRPLYLQAFWPPATDNRPLIVARATFFLAFLPALRQVDQPAHTRHPGQSTFQKLNFKFVPTGSLSTTRMRLG